MRRYCQRGELRVWNRWKLCARIKLGSSPACYRGPEKCSGSHLLITRQGSHREDISSPSVNDGQDGSVPERFWNHANSPLRSMTQASTGMSATVYKSNPSGRKTGISDKGRGSQREGRAGLSQFAPLKYPSPREHLAGVHTMRSGHLGDTRPRFQDQLHHLPLL